MITSQFTRSRFENRLLLGHFVKPLLVLDHEGANLSADCFSMCDHRDNFGIPGQRDDYFADDASDDQTVRVFEVEPSALATGHRTQCEHRWFGHIDWSSTESYDHRQLLRRQAGCLLRSILDAYGHRCGPGSHLNQRLPPFGSIQERRGKTPNETKRFGIEKEYPSLGAIGRLANVLKAFERV